MILKRTALMLAVALLAVAPATVFAQTPAAPAASKPTFLIIGTFHFEGSASDLMGNSLPDTLSEKRQKEIGEVVDALARFRPTKVAIEYPMGHAKVQEAFQAYLDGQRELKPSETEQIAFRLAKKLGHKKIWPVDHKLDMDFDSLMQAVQKYGQQSYFDQAMAGGKAYVGETQRRLDQETVGSALRFMNDPKSLETGHGMYMLMAQVGGAGDAKGAEVVGGWYQRNLYIFSNLVRLIESPEERVLLVIGAGHAKLLRDYIEESPNLRLEETGEYLP
ncbi:MAG TPA: DUF5694 domain-containing protein [Thermoanaerobaculia bacterium]|nr:DUF5694 domain-containing protein [Thermoanaerobaculia bacterium]